MELKQKRGRFGNINIKGQPDSPAYIFKSSDPKFLNNIEPGIKPVLVALVSACYDTFSSCQGHLYKNGRASNRYVELIIERTKVYDWVQRIIKLNKKKNIDLRFFVRLEAYAWLAQTRSYDSPVIFAIVIGSPVDKNLDLKTEALVSFIERM